MVADASDNVSDIPQSLPVAIVAESADSTDNVNDIPQSLSVVDYCDEENAAATDATFVTEASSRSNMLLVSRSMRGL